MKNKKLDIETVRKIKEYLKMNFDPDAVAETFNLSKTQITDIIKERTWKNVK